jgi:outer membrane protein
MRKFLTAAVTVAIAPAPAMAETLQDALTSAYLTNPTLQAQREATRQTDESLAQVRALFLPNVGISASMSTQLRITESPSIFGGDVTRTASANKTYEPQNATISVSQSLFEGGRRVAQLGQVKAQIAGAQEALRSTEQSVLLDVVAAFVDVRRDGEIVRIRANNVELLEQQLQAARDRFEVGEITRTDVAQAQARLAGAGAGLVSAQSDLAASRANYVRLVGYDAGALEAPPALDDLPPSLDEAISIALDLNPDLRRFKAVERAAREQVRIERAELRPQISLVGAMSRDIEPSGINTEVETQFASARLSIPLFEGGFAQSRTRAARIGVLRAQAETEEVRRSIVSTVTAAWNDYLAAQRVIEASREQVRANQLALEGVIQEQMVGLRTTLDVLNAQQELLDSQLNVVAAERNAYVAGNLLLTSIGRLDAEGVGVNAPLYDPNDHRRAVSWTILSMKPADPR